MISVNGTLRPRPPGEGTVADLLAALDLVRDGRGLAVAVDGEVVPRSAWGEHVLPEGAAVEVLTAAQGG
ncbi:MAG TPA: sulfur carrier protein ThiS [Solirubrobacteraceae bacterium]|jgi:sulfur carrier protein|nr:sulfur carrier protein ThiS [Solirubrobacteraceae bacterium]